MELKSQQIVNADVLMLGGGGAGLRAAAVEAGVEIENIAKSGLIDFQQLQPVWQL